MCRNYAVLGRRFKGYSVFVGEAILVELFEGTDVDKTVHVWVWNHGFFNLLGVDSLEVPERFHIGFFFNAHQTKGIYMGKDTDVKESHSFQGTVEKGYKPVDGTYDWMVRTYLVPAR